MQYPFQKKAFYGLDKGSSGIKIAEITEAGGRLAVTRLMKLSLPVEDLPLRPDITPSGVTGLLRQFCRKQGIAGRSVAANLSGAFVASRLFNIPVMSHTFMHHTFSTTRLRQLCICPCLLSCTIFDSI